MVQVKNVRAGMLLITDTGLELKPGEVAEAASLSPDIQRAVATGHLVVVRDDTQTVTPAPPDSASPEGLATLQAPDAVARIQSETDMERLKSWLVTEKRRSVVAAINARLQELGSNTG
ncbi:MAG TPA: hypothetical protein PK468_24160 [Candidatus Hydrogenedentes bacterium]|jgi:hypothetical protein|nr:hypothetical protein [Candidatus Hydrogenedentota bacterium]